MMIHAIKLLNNYTVKSSVGSKKAYNITIDDICKYDVDTFHRIINQTKMNCNWFLVNALSGLMSLCNNIWNAWNWWCLRQNITANDIWRQNNYTVKSSVGSRKAYNITIDDICKYDVDTYMALSYRFNTNSSIKGYCNIILCNHVDTGMKTKHI
jgi:hypothetical protein